ncbi:MAG TPA: CBS domain-containing protein [Kouleothrix sp.]|nr:CBS domain-containing protein [Kouleothrix sp.]
MKAFEIMNPNVVTVRADTSVETIAGLLIQHNIGGVPVVDQQRRVLGIVTERDLFVKDKGIPFSAVKIPTMFKRWVNPRQLDEIYEAARQHTAADVMTSDVICVNSNEDAEEVAWLMVQANLKRIPVLRDGRLIGIIARGDILRQLARKNATDNELALV